MGCLLEYDYWCPNTNDYILPGCLIYIVNELGGIFLPLKGERDGGLDLIWLCKVNKRIGVYFVEMDMLIWWLINSVDNGMYQACCPMNNP